MSDQVANWDYARPPGTMQYAASTVPVTTSASFKWQPEGVDVAPAKLEGQYITPLYTQPAYQREAYFALRPEMWVDNIGIVHMAKPARRKPKRPPLRVRRFKAARASC